MELELINTCFCVIIYAHFFLFWYFLLEEKQKSVDIESVCELLGLVLGSQYRAQVDYLIEYLKVSGYIDHVFRNCNWISCWLLVWVHIPTFPYDFSKVVLISFLAASILRCLWVPFLSCPLACCTVLLMNSALFSEKSGANLINEKCFLTCPKDISLSDSLLQSDAIWTAW